VGKEGLILGGVTLLPNFMPLLSGEGRLGMQNSWFPQVLLVAYSPCVGTVLSSRLSYLTI